MEKMNPFVLDKQSCQSLNLEDLAYILETLKANSYYGDIKWPDGYSPTEENEKKLKKEIENQLTQNNKEYSRYPNDYIHCLLSKYVYNNDLKEGDTIKDLNKWKILKIQNEFTQGNFNKILIYTAVLFVNESQKQLVLSHKGIEVEIKSLTKESGELNSTIKGIVMNEIVPQLVYCYEFTKEANDLAKDNDYYLSFTGYSNGAWLSEHSVFYSYKHFDNQKTKAVLCDSPGMVKTENDIKSNVINIENDFDLKDLNIINYLTAPCFSNSCNKHIGQTFRLFVDTNAFRKSTKWNDFLDNIKKVPIIGKKLVEDNKHIFFFLDGLYSMFNHDNLDLIIELFDSKSGKPS